MATPPIGGGFEGSGTASSAVEVPPLLLSPALLSHMFFAHALCMEGVLKEQSNF